MNRPRIDPPRLRKIGLSSLALLVLLALADPQAALRSLLPGFAFAISLGAGSFALLFIHALTGGAWGAAARPALVSAARSIPATSLLLLPVLVAPALVYPWAGHPDAVRHADVAALYLNPFAFALRSLLVLALWTFLALRARQGASPRFAGLGLLLYGATLSIASVDWILSLDPRFSSSAFAMSMGLAHLLAAAALASWFADPTDDPNADLPKLVAAFALGLLYLDFMQFLVVFDGNLPEKAAFYLARSGTGWNALLLFALAGAGLLPILAVARGRWRRSPAIRRITGGLVLAGLLARTLWWIVPEWTGGPLLWPAMALSLAASLTLPFASPARIRPFGRREARHGA